MKYIHIRTSPPRKIHIEEDGKPRIEAENIEILGPSKIVSGQKVCPDGCQVVVWIETESEIKCLT